MSNLALIIDKEIGFRESLSNYLLMSGYECMLASDRDSAISMVKKYQFDFIMVNAFINNEPATKLLKILQKLRPNSRLIIVSNTAQELSKYNNKEFDCILKPMIFEFLPKLLEKLDKKRLLKEDTSNKKTEAFSVKEKRSLKRSKVDLPVIYSPQDILVDNEEDKKLSKLVDMCEHGAMIIADMFLREQELLNLEILLPPSFRPIVLSGQVCWLKKINQTNKCQMGVKFIDINKETKNSVHQFLSRVN